MILGFLEEKKGLAIGIAVGCLAIAGVMNFSGSDEPVFPPEVGFFCVATGTIHWVDPMKTQTLPMTNPDTGDRTLLPYEMTDGTLYVPERYKAYIKFLSEVNKHVDPETLECKRSE